MTRSRRATDDAVVVPADHGGSSLACLRSLGRRGVTTVGVASSETAAALDSNYCDEAVIAPAPADDLAGYGDALLSLAERPDVATVLPLYEPDVYVLAERRDEFAAHVATPWKPFDAVRRAQDRLRLFDAAAAAGVPTPETRSLDDWDDWDRQAVVKSRYAVLNDDNAAAYPGVRFVGPDDDPDRDEIVEEMGHVPIVQEFVPGSAECGFFALYDEGEPVATFQHRRVRSYTYSGGASVYRESIHDPDLAEAGLALLDELDWHGPAMVEFKRDERDGSYRLVEVNPRFWGSLPLAVSAGVDFPWLTYQVATGGVDPVHDYETGVGCHVLRGEVSYLNSVLCHDYDHVERPSLLSAAADVATSVVKNPNFDYLALDDARPFVSDVLNAAGLRSPG